MDVSTNKDVYECPACQELYEDPPTEDWIRCDSCLEWWHEDCAYLLK